LLSETGGTQKRTLGRWGFSHPVGAGSGIDCEPDPTESTPRFVPDGLGGFGSVNVDAFGCDAQDNFERCSWNHETTLTDTDYRNAGEMTVASCCLIRGVAADT
jgi:hypothetical protein